MSEVQKAANLHPATKYQLSVHYPGRLETADFNTCTDASVEFCRVQSRSVGADKAFIEQVHPDGRRIVLVQWAR